MAVLFKRRWKVELREAVAGYSFILPVFVFISLFVFFPVLQNIRLSFFDWRLLSPVKRFVGTYHYLRLWNDPYFWNAVKVTAYYALTVVPIRLIVSLLLALLVNREIRGRAFFRAAYFIPTVVSTASAAVIWLWMFEPTNGLFNNLLAAVGIDGPGWVRDPSWSMPSIILYSLWNDAGYFMIIFLAGLQNISKQYYEAASIDGARGFGMFRYITWPLLSPTTFLILVMSVIRAWKVFNVIHIMTQGGPVSSTAVIVYYIYSQAFESFNMGYATALSNVFFVIVLLMTLVQFYVSKKTVHYQ